MSDQRFKDVPQNTPASHLDMRKRRRLQTVAKMQGLSKQDAQKIIVYLDALLKNQSGPQ